MAFDALELQDQLEAGELHTALSLYRGPLLPESNSPTLDEWRRYLETALRESALQQANPEPLWSLVRSDAGGLGSDPELLFRLKSLLYTSDPRLALVEARLQLVGY